MPSRNRILTSYLNKEKSIEINVLNLAVMHHFFMISFLTSTHFFQYTPLMFATLAGIFFQITVLYFIIQYYISKYNII